MRMETKMIGGAPLLRTGRGRSARFLTDVDNNYRRSGGFFSFMMKLRQKKGRGEQRMTTKELGSRMEGYFAACDATRERVEQKNGGVSYRQVPYTLAGLAAHLGLDKAEILHRAEGQGGAQRALFLDALRRIERHLVERALMGELQYSVAQMLLRELGCDAVRAPEEDRRVVVVLDDREGWSD